VSSVKVSKKKKFETTRRARGETTKINRQVKKNNKTVEKVMVGRRTWGGGGVATMNNSE